jgi:hypothetical protein
MEPSGPVQACYRDFFTLSNKFNFQVSTMCANTVYTNLIQVFRSVFSAERHFLLRVNILDSLYSYISFFIALTLLG